MSVAAPVRHAPRAGVALSQYVALSQRAILSILRQPAAVIPSMLFPLLFMALSSAAFERSTSLPGFPEVDSFLQFLIATTVVQGALFSSVASGSAMATDIEGGFFERLVASPVARTSILVGRLMGSAFTGFVQAWLYLTIATIFGLTVEGGFVAMVMISIIGALVAAGVGSIAVTLALRTGSSEAVQGSFPLLFSLMFVSSAFFPRTLMNGWFQDVASVNPISHLIEGVRTQVISGLDFGAYLTSLAIALGILASGVALSTLALRKRLEGAG